MPIPNDRWSVIPFGIILQLGKYQNQGENKAQRKKEKKVRQSNFESKRKELDNMLFVNELPNSVQYCLVQYANDLNLVFTGGSAVGSNIDLRGAVSCRIEAEIEIHSFQYKSN